MSKEIEKQYGELSKKYKLPDFKELDSEFEISDIEKTNFLLRAIIRRIAEKLDFYTTMLEEILQPVTSNLYVIHETRFFDENEKRQMYNLYCRMMDFNRQSIIISLENNYDNEVDFINSFFNKWKEIKEELLVYVNKMKDSWHTESEIKEDLGYLG